MLRCDPACSLVIDSDRFIRFKDCPLSEYPERRASGKRFYRVNGGKCDGSNFQYLRVYFSNMGEAYSAAMRTLVDGFGVKSIVGQRLSLGVYPGEYEAVRAAVSSVLPSAAWTTVFCAKQRYGIDDISKAFDDLSGFLFTLYTAKIPKVGPVDVAVNHADGCTQMRFIFEQSTQKAYDAVRAFAAELAGGRDVLEITE